MKSSITRAFALMTVIAIAAASVSSPGDDGRIRMVVLGLPYARVWDAALQALADFSLAHGAAGRIVTGWRERAPRASEAEFARVTERVSLEVVQVDTRVTRVTVEVEARGWCDGTWVALADTEATARAVLARLREAQE